MTSSLWGDLSQLPPLRTPATVLGEQAALLGQATGNLVTARVDVYASGRASSRLSADLVLVAHAINNYELTVATVSYPPEGYPAALSTPLVALGKGTPFEITCADEQEFCARLGTLLSSDHVRRTIAGLMSDSHAVGMTG